jgi:hypothetical protein
MTKIDPQVLTIAHFSAASPLYTKLAAAAEAQNEAQVSALLGVTRRLE